MDWRLLDLIGGYAPAFLIKAALRLEIPDRLGDSAMTGEELAAATQTHRPSLTRTLRALAAIDVLSEVEPDRFRLTPRGQLLRPGVPGSLWPHAQVMLDQTMWRAWPELEHTVRTGKRAFDEVVGTDYFSHTGYDSDPGQRSELWDLIHQVMIEDTHSVAEAVLRSYDFTRFSTVVDVAGGSGTLVAAVLAAHPTQRGIVFDRPEGIENTPGALARAGVADRCEIRTGDFLADVPEGGDLYLIKSAIFNLHEDGDVRTLLRNVRRVIPDHGRLLVIEEILPPRVSAPVPAATYLDDVNTMVNLGGRLRTEDEHRALLADAGFTAVAITPLPEGQHVYHSVLEAAPRAAASTASTMPT